jgi:hypothetical protein
MHPCYAAGLLQALSCTAGSIPLFVQLALFRALAAGMRHDTHFSLYIQRRSDGVSLQALDLCVAAE